MDKLMKQGVDVHATVLRHGETPLMFAARTGRPEAVGGNAAIAAYSLTVDRDQPERST